MSRYQHENSRRQRFPRRLIGVIIVLVALMVMAIAGVRHYYFQNLRPVSDKGHVTMFVVQSGESSRDIAKALADDKLIRSNAVFEWYINVHNARSSLQAGTYALKPSYSVSQIVDLFVKGTVATNYVTIIPGQTIDQVKETFLKKGFKPADVKRAFDASLYQNYEALADKPSGASLEGFLYPDSFQVNSSTSPEYIIKESLNEMAQYLTPTVRKEFANHGLSVYNALTLASIVEKEVDSPSDRAQVAQVFYTRLHKNMSLGSDVTAFYGALQAGQTGLTSVEMLQYDSPYNTLLHKGLPAGPIGTVSQTSLDAVAHPAKTDWLYFVAGDDHKTYFSKTYAEHKTLTEAHCHKLCAGTH